MNSYTYTARDRTGSRREGLLAANSANEAMETLRQRHLTPVDVHETLARGVKKHKAVRHSRVRSADLGAMSWQLSTMLEGGLSITTALDIIAEDTENLQLRHILQRTLAKVSEGKLLSDGLSDFPHVFNRLALAIVIGYYVIGNVHHALHTPLMSETNAISGVIVVGALLQLGTGNLLITALASLAVLIASINVFGGFMVTSRMLNMFRKG